MNDARAHLLLVEDDSLIAFDIARTLEAEGAFSVAVVKFDHRSIIDAMRMQRPDIILMEVCQWQEDRLALMRKIADTGISVIAGTVCDEFRDGVAGFAEVPVMIKPYDPGKLSSLLNQVLSGGGEPAIMSQKIAS